jgi:ribonuclease-3
VLGLVVADHVFGEHPELAEGSLAKLRAAVVSAPTLAEVGDELALGPVLRLGKGEDASGGRAKPSILADAVEAVIGAVYLDGGLDAARSVVVAVLAERIAAEVVGGPGGADHKTQLQELAAHRFDALPTYVVTDEGPDHDKRFRAEVRVGDRVAGVGEGRSKKLAEQAAAGAAIAGLAPSEDPSPAALSTAAPIINSESEQAHA